MIIKKRNLIQITIRGLVKLRKTLIILINIIIKQDKNILIKSIKILNKLFIHKHGKKKTLSFVLIKMIIICQLMIRNSQKYRIKTQNIIIILKKKQVKLFKVMIFNLKKNKNL